METAKRESYTLADLERCNTSTFDVLDNIRSRMLEIAKRMGVDGEIPEKGPSTMNESVTLFEKLCTKENEQQSIGNDIGTMLELLEVEFNLSDLPVKSNDA